MRNVQSFTYITIVNYTICNEIITRSSVTYTDDLPYKLTYHNLQIDIADNNFTLIKVVPVTVRVFHTGN